MRVGSSRSMRAGYSLRWATMESTRMARQVGNAHAAYATSAFLALLLGQSRVQSSNSLGT